MFCDEDVTQDPKTSRWRKEGGVISLIIYPINMVNSLVQCYFAVDIVVDCKKLQNSWTVRSCWRSNPNFWSFFLAVD
jgi:hypothetical protein